MNNEYNRLVSLSTKEKYQDFINKNIDSFEETFKVGLNFDIQKKSESINSNHKSLVLNKLARNENAKNFSRTISGKRDLGKLFALSEIEQHKAIYNGSLESKSYFGNISNINEFVSYHLNRNKKGVNSFYNNIEPSNIYDFFVSYFGLDFTENSEFIKIKEDDFEIEVEGKPNFGNLLTHFTGQKILKLRNFKHSKILKIEINSENQDNVLHYLSFSQMASIISHEFGVRPFLIERGFSESCPFKMYFLSDEYLSNSVKYKLEEYFAETYKFLVNISRDNEFWIAPFSRVTPLYGKLNPGSPLGIEFETIEESYNRIKNMIFNKVKFSYIKNILNKKLVKGRLPKFQSVTSDKNHQDEYYKFMYGEGTRHDNQIKLAFWCIGRGIEFQQYASLAFSLNDGSSKDMGVWSRDEAYRVLNNYYNYASRQVIWKRYADSNEDNDTLIPNEEKKLKKDYHIYDTYRLTYLDSSDNKQKFIKIIEKYYNENYTTEKQQGIWKKYFINDSFKLYSFLIRRREYLQSIEKKYTEDGYEDLNKGICLPSAMFNDLKKHLNLKTNVKKLLKAFILTNLVGTVKINGYKYSYKKVIYSIHYIILDYIGFKNMQSSTTCINYVDSFHHENEIELFPKNESNKKMKKFSKFNHPPD